MPGLSFSNELIFHDKGVHCDFTCLLYDLLRSKQDEARVREIVADVVDIEREFVCDALPVALVGMNGALMNRYTKFITVRVLIALWVQKLRSPMFLPQHVRSNASTETSLHFCVQLLSHST